MPSRTALVLASRGDPFLGVLGRAIGAAVKFGGRAIKGIAGIGGRRQLPAVLPGVGTIQRVGTAARGIIPRVIGSKTGRAVAGAAGLGAVFAGGEAIGRRIIGTTPDGMPVFARRRRRGITAGELRGFNRVVKVLNRVGMVPKGLGRRRKKVC